MLWRKKWPVFVALTTAALLPAEMLRAQSSAGQGLPSSSPASAAKPDPRKARKAYEKGLRLEQAGDWAAAFDTYSEAAGYDSSDREILLRRELARFQVVQQHSDRAERDALAGRLEAAREELRAALGLDPGYSVARERLKQFESSARHAQLIAPPGPGQARVELQPQPGTRDFRYRGDTRGAYEELARQFGLVVSFDPDLPSRQVRFRISGVDFKTAISLLAQETGTFWRALGEHLFFVAQDTVPKRNDYAPVVERTILLPESLTPDKMTETLRLVREIVGLAHVELDTRTRTITVRDTPETVALTMAVIDEIEQSRGEMMLEIEILEVDRDAARQLGITPPSSSRLITLNTGDIRALQQAPNAAALLNILLRIFGTPRALTGLSPNQIASLVGTGQVGATTLIPPLVAIGGGKSTFLATIPGATATFRETLNLVRSGRRMLLRVEDGQPATFFVGDRFPVALALLGPSLVGLPARTIPTNPQQILPRADFPTGTDPVAIVAADLNADGRLDLITANKGANTISVLLGNPDGSFGAKKDFPTGNGPVGVAFGDFNADGKLDLAVVNTTDNSVSVLLGNGDGTFQPKTDFPTGASPVGLAVGDFNADGKLDLAIVNQADNTVSILLGKGDGTFNPKSDFPTGAGPVAILANDFNRDAKLDLVVADETASSVSVLIGNGDGTFKAKKDFPTGTSPVALTTGDFNADGFLDLAVANQASNSVSVLLGKGDGTFSPKTDFATGATPSGILTADFTGDARLDLAVANQGSNTASILVGVGNGTFGFRTDVPTGDGPTALATGDFNLDGRFDLAAANQTSNTVTVVLNPAVVFPAAGIPQTPYPGAEYEDLGLKVRATPRIHDNSEVTLHMEFSIRSLSGVSINGIPVISNRTIDQTVRLQANETTLLAGILDDEETRAITGLPGFASIAGAGHLAGARDIQRRNTELLIVITPRQLRLAPHRDRSIYAGRGNGAPSGQRPAVQP